MILHICSGILKFYLEPNTKINILQGSVLSRTCLELNEIQSIFQASHMGLLIPIKNIHWSFQLKRHKQSKMESQKVAYSKNKKKTQ